MAQREKDDRLENLRESGAKIYSISKVNTIENCEYEAFLKYVQTPRPQAVPNVYGILGGKTHDKLEGILNNTATESELVPTILNELEDLKMLGIEFPKDRNGGDSIRDSWKANMLHFGQTFQRPQGEFNTEQLFIYDLHNGRYVQGYIDVIKNNADGSIDIIDWKTSTMFTKADLKHHGRQLVLYALGKEQEGFTVRNTMWVMLKYADITFMGKARSNAKSKSLITKTIERRKIISELWKYIKSDLEELGYDNVEVDLFESKALETNSFDVLPEAIRQNYIIKPCVVKYSITDELKQETVDYINHWADIFEQKQVENNKEIWNPRQFTKVNKMGLEREDTFYCNCLCGFGSICPHLKKFNDLHNGEDDDLF